MTCAVEVAESEGSVGFVGFDVHGSVREVPLEEYHESLQNWSELEYEFEEGFVDSMAVLVDIEVFEDLGLFDEAYFIYGDETDFEIRAKKAGYELARTNVPVWHHSMGTMGDLPLKSAFLAIRNRLRSSIKHDPPGGILRTILYLYHVGCNPFLDYDEEHVVVKRRRPRGVIFNFVLVSVAIVWNIAHLPSTLKAKRRDYKHIN